MRSPPPPISGGARPARPLTLSHSFLKADTSAATLQKLREFRHGIMGFSSAFILLGLYRLLYRRYWPVRMPVG